MNHSLFKKGIKIMLAGICAVMALTSCSSATQSNSKTDESAENFGNNEEIVINFAVMGKADYIKDAVNKFNDADNGYHVELIDYYHEPESNGESSPLKLDDLELIQDISNTNDIDIVSSYSFFTESNYMRLAEKGAFTDLYKFMENDADVNTSTLNSHILSVNEIDKKLFTIPTFYVAYTLGGNPEYVGTKNNWSCDDLINCWEKMPSNAVIAGEQTKEAAYRMFVINNLVSFIDYENGNVRFDSPDFRKLLEFCNGFEYANQQKTDLDFNAPVFCSMCIVDSFMGIYPFKLGSSKPEFTFVGFPSQDGNGAYLRSFADSFSISAKSSEEKQRGAWEFVRTFFLEEWQEEYSLSVEDRQNGYASQNCFCINNKAFENVKNNVVNKKYSPATYEDKGETYTTEFPTLEDCNALEQYLNSIDRWAVNLDDDLTDIVTEEVMTYFADEISIDECIDRIQNRASIWISERY